MAQTFVGTLTYMSPERIAGEVGQVDVVSVLLAPKCTNRVVTVKFQVLLVRDMINKCVLWNQSPEQPYNATSDIWSFGMSILTCALGKFPLDASGKIQQA